MPFDAEYLTRYSFPESRQTYTARDTILYALGLGFGSRPTDPDHLQFTYEVGLKTLPTMAVVLAHPGFWAANPDLGIDWTRMLQGGQGLTVHRPLPVKGEVVGRGRIAKVVDRGPGKGALLYYERDVIEAATGELLATVRQTLLCRGNGGFGGPRVATPSPHAMPKRAPDLVAETKTLPQQALIYRLSGDINPLHVDPHVARKAGFDAPILHGLATYGLAAAAMFEHVCGFDAERFGSFDARFTAPVFPGETIRTEIWVDDAVVSLRAKSVERDKLVIDNGQAIVAQARDAAIEQPLAAKAG